MIYSKCKKIAGAAKIEYKRIIIVNIELAGTPYL